MPIPSDGKVRMVKPTARRWLRFLVHKFATRATVLFIKTVLSRGQAGPLSTRGPTSFSRIAPWFCLHKLPRRPALLWGQGQQWPHDLEACYP
ncbi:hypothetical protein BDV19DRAFT_364053 [Aspergillus venezuelensis]